MPSKKLHGDWADIGAHDLRRVVVACYTAVLQGLCGDLEHAAWSQAERCSARKKEDTMP